MKTPARRWHTAAIAVLLFSGSVSLSSSEADLQEGRDFVRVPAQTAAASRASSAGLTVQVLEFFSYGCSACYEFRPLAAPWIADLPPNTAIEHIPTALGRRAWKPLVRMYYALQASGHYERLDQALFDAINRDQRSLFDEEALMAWVASQRVDAEGFRAVYHSQGVSERVSRAEQMDKAYAIPATPTLVIDGQYIPKGATFKERLRIASRLLDQAHARRSEGR